MNLTFPNFLQNLRPMKTDTTPENLSLCVGQLLSVYGITQAQLAAKMKRPASVLTEITKGGRALPKTINGLCLHLAKTSQERGDLIDAHLRDECIRAEIDFADFVTRGLTEEDLEHFSRMKHVPMFIRLANEADRDPELLKIIEGLDEIIEQAGSDLEIDGGFSHRGKCYNAAI